MPRLRRYRLLIATLSAIIAIENSLSQDASKTDFLNELRERLNFLDEAISESPNSHRLFQTRGETHFYLGDIEQSIADFDRVLELIPSQEPRHWQRGISYYYAGEFAKGVAQFKLHQTVNPQDVENAVWHFLCSVRVDGIAAAKQSLIPVARDYRVPMSQIWELFSGEITPEIVLEAANANGTRQSLCYAHLYIGLYYEALGKGELAEKHLRLAANDHFVDNYMGRVAKVHVALLKAKSAD